MVFEYIKLHKKAVGMYFIFALIFGIISVSYTHLFMIKRKRFSAVITRYLRMIWIQKGRPLKNGPPEIDVYKRQMLL